jgi:hypothetical protein
MKLATEGKGWSSLLVLHDAMIRVADLAKTGIRANPCFAADLPTLRKFTDGEAMSFISAFQEQQMRFGRRIKWQSWLALCLTPA